MADNVLITAGSGTTIAADDVGSGVLVQRVKATWGPDGTANDTDVASGKPLPVQLRSSGGVAMSDSSGLLISTTQLSALSTTQTALAAGVQMVALPTDLAWPKGLSNKVFVAAFTTLTRPANTTAYTAGDSISDNATAGSVTALSATVSDTNDDPIFITDILITSTDTGLAGKRIRAYLYNSDPTASSGVGGGDNAAFAQKKAGYIGSFSGRLEAGFSDGTPGRLVPSFQLAADTTDTAGAPAGGFVMTKPTSGAKTLFIQFQAIDGFTPSANSTTIIATARGWQGRAA
jgi:hypothetical protein